ncbi:MAG: DASS family sodium-coupled anion symporter [Candidatus Zixiibacteriota bacterium]
MPEPINIDPQGYLIVKVNWKLALKVFIVLALAFGAGFLPIPGLSGTARICLMIFVGAAGFWITEAIPPFATAIMVIVLSVYFLAATYHPTGVESGLLSYQVFLNPIASPVLVLFFGGFILEAAAVKHGFDLRLTKALIKPFGTNPRMVLLGVIVTTAVFSMFMSNTAATAMMFAAFTPLFRSFEDRGQFRKALILAVPFAANIGGMGTIIGTPPNAVAASVLGELGYPISFLKWMVVGVPIMMVLIFLLWFILLKAFKPRAEKFEILFPEPLAPTWDFLLVVITFFVTVFLWVTEALHHIPAGVVALLPVMIFTMFGIINREDLKKLEWDVLILVAGGMALGVAMKSSGLSDVLVGMISFQNFSPLILLLVIALVTIIVSNFMSHTSASNLLIPIVTSLTVMAPQTGGSPITQLGTLGVAFAASLAMSLPISTPPNAIAFATREITTREMAKYGTMVSLFGVLVILLVLLGLWYLKMIT